MYFIVLMCFQYPCMQLINAIVSTPDDLDFRLHLRNEFMRSGLIDAIEVNEIYHVHLCFILSSV